MTKALLKKMAAGLGLLSCASKPTTKKTSPKSKSVTSEKKLFNGAFNEKYSVQQVIGTGGFGTVYSGYRKSDQKPVAIKVARKDKVKGWIKSDGKLIPREVWCLQHVTHVDGAVHLLDFYDHRSSSSYILVMERPEHGQDLFDYITDRQSLEESEARGLLQQVVETLVAVHEAGILHRDVKDENIIVDLDTKRVRLVDFGSATQLKESDYTDFDGTVLYSSPEWLRHRHYSAVPYTVWTVGILLYDMVCGNIPFHSASSIVQATPSLPDRLSPEVQSLIRRCLAVDPAHRPTLEQILEDPWMTSPPALSPTTTSTISSSSSDAANLIANNPDDLQPLEQLHPAQEDIAASVSTLLSEAAKSVGDIATTETSSSTNVTDVLLPNSSCSPPMSTVLLVGG